MLYLLVGLCFFCTPLSMSAQCVTRNVTNCKSFDPNQAIGAAMQGFFTDGSNGSFQFASGATIADCADGAATLTGSISQFGNAERRFKVSVNLVRRACTLPAGASPEINNLPAGTSTSGWYYYEWGAATLTGEGQCAGATLNLVQHMMPAQAGVNAHNQAADVGKLGFTGWFEWKIVTQPSNNWLIIAPYANGIADFCFVMDGTPPSYCPGGGGGNPCANDVTPPTIANCPSNINLTTTGTCATPNWAKPTATDNCSGTVTINQTSGPLHGTCFPIGTSTVIYTATDAKGNKSTCSFTVTVSSGNVDPCLNDATPPVISGCPTNINLTTSSTCATATWTAPTATDNCGTATVTSNYNSGFCFPIGSTTVTYTAKDAKGNASTCSFTVTVTATGGNGGGCNYLTGPNPAGIPWSYFISNVTLNTINNTSSKFTEVNGVHVIGYGAYTGISTCILPNSNQTISVTPSASYVEGPIFIRAWIDYNKDGDFEDAGELILDKSTTSTTAQSAAFTVPASASGPTRLRVSLNQGSAPTSCDSPAKGEVEDYTITFNCGVANPCDTDATPPTFANCPSNINLTTTGTCANASWTAPTAADNCSTPSVSVTSAPTAGLGIGSCFPVGTTTVTYKATDAKGNVATCIFTVTVTKTAVDPCANDATPPTIANCPTNISLTTTGTCATPNWAKPTASDNCPGTVTIAQTSGPLHGTCFPIGTSTVVYTATDAKGNTATCTFTVTVTKTAVDPCATDATAPTFTNCPTNINLTTTGTCANASWTAPTATDNCGTPSVSVTSAPIPGLGIGSCFPVGTTTITYRATDAKGNAATCVFTVTVVKAADPCAGIVNIRPILNTKDKCNTGTSYVAVWNGVFYTAGTNLKFTEFTNGTATITGNIHANGNSYVVNATYSGRTCTSAGSPKLGDGNGVCASGFNSTNWYYYTTLSGTMTTVHGTINLTRNGPAFQVGDFANLQQNVFGASGWFFGNGTAGGDFNFNLGPCSSCCSGSAPIVCNNPPATGGGLDPNKCYKIVNKATGKVLDVYQGSNNDYAKIIQWTYAGYANQKWRVIDAGGGFFQLRANNSGKYLDLTGSGNDCWDDVQTEQFGFDGSGSQMWKLNKQSDGSYKIVNKTCSNGSLKVWGCSNNEGASVVICSDNGSNCFKWDFVEVTCTNAQHLTNSTVMNLSARAESSRSRLEWVNNTGLKNDYFTIQKMDEPTGNFKDIDVVKAGAVNDKMQYFVAYDNNPTEGDNYYRVKTTYTDGTFAVTELQKVTHKGLGEIRIFPNPSDDHIDVDLSKLKGKAVSIFIYNQIGHQVAFKTIEAADEAPVRMDVSDYTSGHFLIRITTKGQRDMTKQLIIQR